MFQPLVPNIEDNDLDALLETYMAFKMEPDGEAADTMVVIVPGAEANAIGNESASKVIKRFRQLVPKHPAPKVASVEILQQDALNRFKGSRLAFQSKGDDILIHVSMAKKQRKQMKYLKSSDGMFCDTLFNRFPVGAIPLRKLHKVPNKVEHDKIFASDVEMARFMDSDDNEHTAALAEEAETIKDEELVPFPQEHDGTLLAELSHVFDCQVNFLVKFISGPWWVHKCKIVAKRTKG